VATFDWKTATTDAKLEQLKKDIETAFDAINVTIRNQTSAAQHLTDVKQTLNNVLKTIDTLEKKPAAA